jgi:hypothetical protein
LLAEAVQAADSVVGPSFDDPQVSRRFVKKQQMSWTLEGAHLLLQTRTKVLNNELDDVFPRWYPKFWPVAQPPVPERKVA